ncbi:MAG TPA: tripartite tricarboxylate transporter substrate binding protein, partial [Burkholderiales bacterium]|nr:tripartite tricarboxylate transporter substrate binding protein [Burkholderiales bacterium]
MMLVLLLTIANSHTTQAQTTYPTRPIRVINPYAPGGGSDILARRFAQELTTRLGQSVIVENVAGAGGIPGMRQVADAPKDGYTLSFALTAQFAINSSLFANLPYDALRDFDPVSVLAAAPYVLVVHPSLPARSVRDLIALAKKQPGALAYASAGNGSGPHLSGALLNTMAGIDMLHIPYKGGGPGLIDVLAGRVPMIFVIYPSMAGHLKAGKLRALGVTTAKRVSVLPEVPAIAEILPGYQADVWYMAAVPAGTPKDIIARLNSEFVRALNAPAIRQSLDGDG